MIRQTFIFTAIAALLLAGCGSSGDTIPTPRMQNGTLDARSYDFEAGGAIHLDGDWEFHWLSLDDPSGAADRPVLEKPYFIEVPSPWNGSVYNGEPLPGSGHATYRATVLLSDSHHTRLALKVLDMGTSCEIFANGVSIYAAGRPSTSKNSTEPGYRAAVIPLDGTNNTIEIVIHVSNYHYRIGGMWESILLGTYADLSKIREKRLLRDSVLFGCILIMGLYHLILFGTRRDRSFLVWFGIFCVLIALRMLVTGERYLVELVSGTPWEVFPKLEYLTFYLAVPVFAQYLMSMYPSESVRPIMAAVAVVSLLFSIFVLVVPASIFTYTLTVYQIWTFMIAVYAIVVIARAISRRRVGSISILVGFLLFFVTVVNDILYAAAVIYTFHAVSYGLVVFIFYQALHIASIFNFDFSTVKRQSIAIREANDIINSSPAVAFRWKAEEGWPIEFVSENSVGLTGYTVAELVSGELPYRQIIHPDDVERVDAEVASFSSDVEKTLASHSPYRIITKNGEERWVSDKTFIHRDAAGDIIHYRGIIEDITELKIINDELEAHRNHLEELVASRTHDLELAMKASEAASIAKSEFLASMSHELRTPLNHIIGFAGLVAERRVGSLTPEQDEYLQDALSSARHLLNLINEILDIAKVESGTLQLQASEVEIQSFVEDTARSFREQATERGITIEHDASGAPSTVSADAKRLKQIMFNLMSNAVKFSDNGGIIRITAETGSDHSVQFSVADQGIGIAPADQERIFEAFEQASASTQRTHSGTGLGLSLTKALVSLHGGAVWVESEGKGKGSTFFFSLPREPEDGE